MKVSELEGAELDYWVAKAVHGEDADKIISIIESGITGTKYSPSTDWSHGGPLIEKYNIDISPEGDGQWVARCWGDFSPEPDWFKSEAPLIAAMRALVANEFGEEVE